MQTTQELTASFNPSDDSIDEDTYTSDSDSDSGSCSFSEPWSDDDDDDDDGEFVLCLTSRGARRLEPTSALCPTLPRRLSFKPLEAREDTTQDLTVPVPQDTQAETPVETPPPQQQQQQHSKTPTLFQNSSFVVSQSTIAGWGAFAVRTLLRGESILVERPLFVADSLSLFKEFAKLDAPAKRRVLELHAHDGCKPGFPRLQAIWMANCFSTGERDTAGLFPIASRFNHSCQPGDNVEYAFDPETQTLEMVVKADSIRAGDELTISYGTKRTPLDLYVRYGFRCRCGTCPGLRGDEEGGQW